ncbi:MAG: hypothetical protein AAB433_01335 [Nitrospirota bacterium]
MVKASADGSKKEPFINLSIAISAKALGKQQSGVTSLAAVGEGVFSVPNVEIGKDGKPYRCKPKETDKDELPICPESDLVAYPVGKGPSSITVSVAETGNVDIDFDQTTEELRAIKEALGPAIKDSLKEALK